MDVYYSPTLLEAGDDGADESALFARESVSRLEAPNMDTVCCFQ